MRDGKATCQAAPVAGQCLVAQPVASVDSEPAP
jgi:hypothetical protein